MKIQHLFLSALILILLGCSDTTNEQATQSRSFKMGFTPWPYAATAKAVDDIYSFINSSSDMIAHHMDAGVPWNEAQTANNFSNYGSNVQSEINDRVNRTVAMGNKTVYLAISPFSGLRDDIALYWNSAPNQALSAPFDSYDIGSDAVILAYSNYVDELIKKLQPSYVNYAIEVNEYYHNRSTVDERNRLTKFISSVYNTLKNLHPDIEFMTSFVLTSPGSAKMQESSELFKAIANYNDLIGISIYPYAFFSHANKGDPANLPADWLDQIKVIAPNKSYFIAETGFIGEPLSIPEFGLDVTADETMQNKYVEMLFSEADKLDAKGIVWYTAYDFDDLWTSHLNDPYSLIWRDTGLKDGTQQPRAALSTWEQWLDYAN